MSGKEVLNKDKSVKKVAKRTAKSKGGNKTKVAVGRTGRSSKNADRSVIRHSNTSKVTAVVSEVDIDEVFGDIIKEGIRKNGIKTVSRSSIMKALGK
jgi:hypothetical protein